jgi:hypothetical protein
VDEQRDLDNERVLLDLGRRKMNQLRRQYMIKGTNATFDLLEEMRITTEQIRFVKQTLRQWGDTVDDSPNDELPTFAQPVMLVTEERTPAKIQASTILELQPIVGGNLGFGLQIGGVHEGAELLALASPEHPHKDGWIRSGWLYSNHNADAHLAVAFFKIYRSPDKSGYVHIRNVASPPHLIWLTAPSPTHQQALFHYTPARILLNDLIQLTTESADWLFLWENNE